MPAIDTFSTAFAPGFAAALDVGRARLAWSLNRFNGLAAQSRRPGRRRGRAS